MPFYKGKNVRKCPRGYVEDRKTKQCVPIKTFRLGGGGGLNLGYLIDPAQGNRLVDPVPATAPAAAAVPAAVAKSLAVPAAGEGMKR